MYERRAEETCEEQAYGEGIPNQYKTYLGLVIVYPPLAFGMLRNPPFRPHSRTDWPEKPQKQITGPLRDHIIGKRT